MIWLASFPRSGSTFVRIVLHEVYGLESSTWHREPGYPVDTEYTGFPVVKTHLLPHELEPADSTIPAVYLIRDGRDCMVSMAHYRKQLVEASSHFEDNLREVILAQGNSHFGGWSQHVRAWRDRAALILRFEDIVANPIQELEKLRVLVDLPPPRLERLPQFGDLRSRSYAYGSGRSHGLSDSDQATLRQAKFRLGKSGGWKNALPESFHLLFLRYHGDILRELAYDEGLPLDSGSFRAPPPRVVPAAPRRVLIDGIKLADLRSDGIRRYAEGLLYALAEVAKEQPEAWQITVAAADGRVFDLERISNRLAPGRSLEPEASSPPPLNLPDKLANWSAATQHWVDLIFYKVLGLRAVRGWVRNFLDHKKAQVDLLHLLLPNTARSYRFIQAPRITTVHDLTHRRFPSTMTEANHRTLREGIAQAQADQSKWIAVSAFTRDELVELEGVDGAAVSVTLEGCDHRRFFPETRPQVLAESRASYKLPDHPYFLALGTVEPRKNLSGVVSAFQELRRRHPSLHVSLLIAGANGWGVPPAIGTTPGVRRIGFIAEEHLAAIYSQARALCFFSHYEGFGLPPLEAMSCGTPVIYANTSAIPEVVGHAGLPISPGDLDEAVQAMFDLLTDHELHQRLSRAAALRATDFTWRAVALRTLAAYERAILAGGTP